MADEFTYNKISRHIDFESMFKISSDQDLSNHAILDCQSFFQKMDFKDKDGQLIFENVISINECEYLYDNITACIKESKTKCIDSDDLYNESCECK